MTSKLALQWLPCQEPGVIGSVLGPVGPVSVYCDWVRWKVLSAASISVWQHVTLSEQTDRDRERDRDRDKGKQIEKETTRDRAKQKETERDRDKGRATETQRDRDRQTDETKYKKKEKGLRQR